MTPTDAPGPRVPSPVVGIDYVLGVRPARPPLLMPKRGAKPKGAPSTGDNTPKGGGA